MTDATSTISTVLSAKEIKWVLMFEFKFHNVVINIAFNKKNNHNNFFIDLLKDKTAVIKTINKIKGILFPAIINPVIIKMNDRDNNKYK